MEFGNGGERGEAKSSPHHAESEALSGPRSRSAESSNPSERGETPATLGGLMLVECCVCHVALPPVPVAVDDKVNGKMSSGYCPKHEAEAMAEVHAMQVPVVADDSTEGEATEDLDEDEEAEATAYLTGLGLWSLPGGFWIALFIPWSVLEMAVGGGR